VTTAEHVLQEMNDAQPDAMASERSADGAADVYFKPAGLDPFAQINKVLEWGSFARAADARSARDAKEESDETNEVILFRRNISSSKWFGRGGIKTALLKEASASMHGKWKELKRRCTQISQARDGGVSGVRAFQTLFMYHIPQFLTVAQASTHAESSCTSSTVPRIRFQKAMMGASGVEPALDDLQWKHFCKNYLESKVRYIGNDWHTHRSSHRGPYTLYDIVAARIHDQWHRPSWPHLVWEVMRGPAWAGLHIGPVGFRTICNRSSEESGDGVTLQGRSDGSFGQD
jgi:hypothetical protein